MNRYRCVQLLNCNGTGVELLMRSYARSKGNWGGFHGRRGLNNANLGD
jgi:hypothetical protein